MLQMTRKLREPLRRVAARAPLPEPMLEEPYRPMASAPARIRLLKDRFKGERCFVLGNGPSLNHVDFSRLAGEFTFGVNGIFLLEEINGFIPTAYSVEDRHVVNDNLAAIAAVRSEYRFYPAQYRGVVPGGDGVVFLNANRGFYEPRSKHHETPRFSKDLARRVYLGQSVTIMNLQIAFYMGFTTVHLVGMDFSYQIPASAVVDGRDILSTEADANHFHPDYFGPGKRWHDPKLENVLASYRLCRAEYERHGRTILNSTHGGQLEAFERFPFERIFR